MAPECAWAPLGWESVWASEIDPFCNLVISHRSPGTVNLGDMTKILKDHEEYLKANPVDIVCGGTPCQGFSVAGKRGGMDDPRSQLAWHFFAIVDRVRPRWVIWENVPGALSSGGGRDLGAILTRLGQCGYGWAYRILDAQYFGVPQRRRRIFLVGYLGDWRPAAAVLFDTESLSGNFTQSRKKGETVTALTSRGVGTCGPDDNQAQGGHIVVNAEGDEGHPFLTASNIGKTINNQRSLVVAPLLIEGDSAASTPDLNRGRSGCGRGGETYVFQSRASAKSSMNPGEVSPTIDAGKAAGISIFDSGHPRRLTPVECERLQGFPDNWTLIPGKKGTPKKYWKENEHYLLQMGFPSAEAAELAKHPDGPRYKALGNSMAVPVLRWLGERIMKVENLL